MPLGDKNAKNEEETWTQTFLQHPAVPDTRYFVESTGPAAAVVRHSLMPQFTHSDGAKIRKNGTLGKLPLFCLKEGPKFNIF